MHVKTGDTVQVISGADKGKVGKIVKVVSKTGEVLVEGVNIKVGAGSGGRSERGTQRHAAGGARGAGAVERGQGAACAATGEGAGAGGGSVPGALERRQRQQLAGALARWPGEALLRPRGSLAWEGLLDGGSAALSPATHARTPPLTPRLAPTPPPPPPPAAQTKHNKPTSQGEAGQITKKEYPVHHSNVALYSVEKKVASRVGHK